MNLRKHRRYGNHGFAGFGLVELMVGLAIGMIATLVIVQVVTTFEGQKRSSTGTADAQTSGTVAIYSMQRQIQMAGYGLPMFSNQSQVLNCANAPTRAMDVDSDPATPPEPVPVSITPLEIVNGANGASDAVIVRKGNTALGGMPLPYRLGIPLDQLKSISCKQDDLVLVTNGSECRLTTVTAAPTAAAPNQNLTFANTFSLEGVFACLGSEWQEWRYTVDANLNLLERGAPIASGVVSMQARYGISLTAKNNEVTEYVDAVDPEWGPSMSVANRNRIKAIRVALVVRNSTLEKENVTEACSSLTDAAPTGLCAWAGTADNPAPEIDLSADPDWQRYRYRVFDTIIPIRNLIWSVDKL